MVKLKHIFISFLSMLLVVGSVGAIDMSVKEFKELMLAEEQELGARTNTGTGSGSGDVGSGTTGQFPYYAANGTTLTATSSLFIDTSGNIGIGTTSPSTELDINGSLAVTASTTFNGVEYLFPSADGSANQALLTNGAGGLLWGVGSQWTTTGSDIYYSTGDVGIGTSTNLSRLTIKDTLNAATGNESAMQLNYTTNKATSGNDTGLLINLTDTASPGTSYLIDAQLNGASKFTVGGGGIVTGTRIMAEDGSLGNLALRVNNTDTDNGFYRPGTDQLGMVAGGVEGIRITEDTTIDINAYGTITMNNDTWFRGLDYAGASNVNMFKINESDQIEVGATLSLGDTFNVVEDGGMIRLINQNVTSDQSAGTVDGYTFGGDNTDIMAVYYESDGAGGIQNERIGIGTTTPGALLDIYDSATSTLMVSSDSATQGACLKLRDSDGAGWSYVTILNGTLTATSTSCE